LKAEVFGRELGDDFLDLCWAMNFGEASTELGSRLDTEKSDRASNLKSSKLEDLTEIMQNMPEMKKKLKNLSKHSDIFKFLNKELESRDLYTISGLQQDISTDNKKTEHYNSVIEVINSSRCPDEEKIKLALMYGLKYSEDQDRLNGLKSTLRKKNIQADYLDYITKVVAS
jgi:vacuolar protein sorting-associated protein 45